MEKESLKASVQYNDWLGTIALDNDHKDLYDYFKDKVNNEHILGFNVHIYHDHNKIGISIYTGSVSRDQETGKRTDKKHPKVKKYKTELTIQDFLGLFKRINIKVFEDLEAKKDTKLTVIEEIYKKQTTLQRGIYLGNICILIHRNCVNEFKII